MDKRDKNRILVKLDDMTRYISELRDMLPSKQGYMNDLVKRRACEKTIESAIESMIDAAAIIVSSERLGLPTDEESIFDLLIEHNVIPETVAQKAKEMKGFRNILIHRYADVDDELVYQHLRHRLSDFHGFKEAVETYLKQ
ncbi:MAG: DUF86 domain-containing protein [Thermoplasmatota archaeon]